jgi:hypothetical protein
MGDVENSHPPGAHGTERSWVEDQQDSRDPTSCMSSRIRACCFIIFYGGYMNNRKEFIMFAWYFSRDSCRFCKLNAAVLQRPDLLGAEHVGSPAL